MKFFNCYGRQMCCSFAITFKFLINKINLIRFRKLSIHKNPALNMELTSKTNILKNNLRIEKYAGGTLNSSDY